MHLCRTRSTRTRQCILTLQVRDRGRRLVLCERGARARRVLHLILSLGRRYAGPEHLLAAISVPQGRGLRPDVFLLLTAWPQWRARSRCPHLLYSRFPCPGRVLGSGSLASYASCAGTPFHCSAPPLNVVGQFGLMLLTFITTHVFQFRFADAEHYRHPSLVDHFAFSAPASRSLVTLATSGANTGF